MRVYVPLDSNERRALVLLSERECRDFRQQAALFVRQGLERAGLLPATDPATSATATKEGQAAGV